MSIAKRVVIVDDEILIAMHIRTLCEQSGAQVVGVAHDFSTAKAMILRERPDYAIMDLRLGEKRDGVDIAKDVSGHLPDIKFIFVTAASDGYSIARIESVKPKQIFNKPIAPSAFHNALD